MPKASDRFAAVCGEDRFASCRLDSCAACEDALLFELRTDRLSDAARRNCVGALRSRHGSRRGADWPPSPFDVRFPDGSPDSPLDAAFDEVLLLLVGTSGPSIRTVLAGCRLSAEALDLLIHDPDDLVRGMVAWEHASNPAASRRLIHDASSVVRFRIFDDHGSTVDLEAFVPIADDPVFGVRRAAAEHPSCPAFVLAAFASDEDCDVRAAASRRLETLSRHERLEALLELRALSPEKADAAALLATLLSP